MLFVLILLFGLFLVGAVVVVGLRLDLPGLAEASWFAITAPLLAMESVAFVSGCILLKRAVRRKFHRVFVFALLVLGPLEIAVRRSLAPSLPTALFTWIPA